MREFSVPASFTVGEHDTVVSSVFSHERDDPDHVIIQRLVDGSWADVTCRAGRRRRSVRLHSGLIAEGVKPGDRVAMLSATRYEWPIIDFAILSIGAVTVPIYETSSAEQVQVRAGRLGCGAGVRRDRRARRHDRAAQGRPARPAQGVPHRRRGDRPRSTSWPRPARRPTPPSWTPGSRPSSPPIPRR